MPLDGRNYSAPLTRGRRNALDFADWMEAVDYGFDFRNPIPNPECGTAGCIGGHWEVWRRPAFGWFVADTARDFGMSSELARTLCFAPRDRSGRLLKYDDITKRIAVAAIIRYALTGEVYFDLADDAAGKP